MGTTASTTSTTTIPSKPKVLCLASSDTTLSISNFCKSNNLHLTRASTVKKALHLINETNQNNTPYHLIVAALGTNKSTIIFDQAGDRSTLINLAKQSNIHFVVYSHTACRIEGHRLACIDAGADAVLCTVQALTERYQEEVELSSRSFQEQKQASHQITNTTATSETTSNTQHPSITYRLQREIQLVQNQDIAEPRFQRQLSKLAALRIQLQHQLDSLQRPLLRQDNLSSIRVVFVSDTHNHHHHLSLPSGDILLHAGDAVGNYGKTDIKIHFQNYIQWLIQQSKRYQHVIFIAGNHDTLLDGNCYNTSYALELLQTLPKNVHYLENESVVLNVTTHKSGVVRNVHIFGSPVTASRQESMGKKYYSDGFERTNQERKILWEKVPSTLDILLTHTPPTFNDLMEGTFNNISLTNYGDPLLTKKLNTLTSSGIVLGGGVHRPPRFHCFGHDHDGFGVAQNSTTTFLNGAQEGVIRYDQKVNKWVGNGTSNKNVVNGIGFPLVFDC